MTKPAPTADLILHHGLFTTLDRAHPTATAVAIRDGRFLAVGADKEVMALAGPKTKVDRPQGPARPAGPDRQPPPHHPRRAQLQHGAALGRRAQPRRRHAHAEASRSPHAAAAVGARGRRLHRAPVRREAAADARRDQRRRARHAGLHPAPLRPGAPQRAPRCAPSATPRTRPNPPGGEIERDARGQPDRPAARQAQRRRSSTRRWPRGRSCRSTIRSTRRATSCAS